MVHELIYQYTDLSWPLDPCPQFLRGSPGDSNGNRNAIRARFAPRPVSFTTASLGRVGHAQTLAKYPKREILYPPPYVGVAVPQELPFGP
jgi:hypothetical protein